ncbi:MAG: type sorting protein, partial [Bacteroidetes bacterium]|nr:type sorting protein [Bacteroidota bacterium]
MKNYYPFSNIRSFTFFCFFLLLFKNTTVSAQANTWTQKASFGGAPRYGVTSFTIGSKGYIGCGSFSSTYMNDFWEYDPATNVWTQKANFAGNARYYASGFGIGNKGYIGCGNSPNSFYNDFYEYDPSLNTWTAKANFPGAGRYSAVGLTIGSKGYIGTGAAVVAGNNVFYQDFYAYDPTLNTWTAKANFPIPRGSATGFSIGNNCYVGTGWNGNILTDFYEYNSITNTWTAKASVPVGRFAALGLSIGSKGYIGAGNLTTSVQGDDFYEYNPVTNTWTAKANCGGGLRGYGPACFTIGNKGYIGCGLANSVYKNDFWEYYPNLPGEALNFDGTNDYVTLGSGSTLKPTSAL